MREQNELDYQKNHTHTLMFSESFKCNLNAKQEEIRCHFQT